jgi:hypothetical protein
MGFNRNPNDFFKMPQVGRKNEKEGGRIKIFKVVIPQIEMKKKSERAF